MIIKNRTFFISSHVSDYYRHKFAREILQRGGSLEVLDKERADSVIYDAERYTACTFHNTDEAKLYITVNEMVRFFDASPLYKRVEFVIRNGTLLKWIPEESEGYALLIPEGVRVISCDAFVPTYPCQEPLFRKAKKYITRIILPKSLEVIGKDAFRGFSSLAMVNFKGGIRELTGFRGCRSLKSITIPKSCETIGDYAFAGCKSLKEIVWNDKVTAIGRNAFSSTALEAFGTWDALTEIGDYAFANTAGLETLTIGNVKIRCGKNAFAKSGIKTLTVRSDDCRFAPKCFEGCTQLTQMDLRGNIHITPTSFPLSIVEDGLKKLNDPEADETFKAMIREMMTRYRGIFVKVLPFEMYLAYEDVIEQVMQNGSASREKMDPVKKEAVLRLRMLEKQVHLSARVRKHYMDGKLYYSYVTAGGFMGSIDTIDYDPRYEKIVEDAERYYGIHVYHCVESYMPWESLALLYVEKDRREWQEGRPEDGYTYAYVYNFEFGEGEFGTVGFDTCQGVLYRIA